VPTPDRQPGRRQQQQGDFRQAGERLDDTMCQPLALQDIDDNMARYPIVTIDKCFHRHHRYGYGQGR